MQVLCNQTYDLQRYLVAISANKFPCKMQTLSSRWRDVSSCEINREWIKKRNKWFYNNTALKKKTHQHTTTLFFLSIFFLFSNVFQKETRELSSLQLNETYGFEQQHLFWKNVRGISPRAIILFAIDVNHIALLWWLLHKNEDVFLLLIRILCDAVT